jgi:hypothetical protein
VGDGILQVRQEELPGHRDQRQGGRGLRRVARIVAAQGVDGTVHQHLDRFSRADLLRRARGGEAPLLLLFASLLLGLSPVAIVDAPGYPI